MRPFNDRVPQNELEAFEIGWFLRIILCLLENQLVPSIVACCIQFHAFHDVCGFDIEDGMIVLYVSR